MLKTARVKEIISPHEEIRGYFPRFFEKVIRIGQLLSEQKAILPHGG